MPLLLSCLPAVGAFESVAADALKAGDSMPALADAANPAAGFVPVTVTRVEPVMAEGAYAPLLESPYILADSVVTVV